MDAEKERVPMGAAPVLGSRARLLRIVLVLDAMVFFGAALFNFGLEVPVGFATLRFADSIWQAGTGEVVIGSVLLAAGVTGGRRLSWVALVMSVLGIAFGLSSDRVQGAARDLHVVMIAFAVLVLALLLVTGRRNRRSVAGRAASVEEAK
jgi:hypothetical protein